MPDGPIKIAVLISGSGTTLQNLIDRIREGSLNAKIVQVIASRPGIGGIERAGRAGLACEIVERKKFTGTAEFSEHIFSRCERAGAELVCLAGWLSMLAIPPKWEGKVMNIHPALLPRFGGAGMFGLHVHEAVIRSGEKTSGCTVHFVNNEYDAGPIILQRSCPVMPGDTPQTLAKRVFEEEKIAYPEAIELFRSGRLRIEGGAVRIAPSR